MSIEELYKKWKEKINNGTANKVEMWFEFFQWRKNDTLEETLLRVDHYKALERQYNQHRST